MRRIKNSLVAILGDYPSPIYAMASRLNFDNVKILLFTFEPKNLGEIPLIILR